MVEKAGLDPKKPPKTGVELFAWAEKLTIRDASGKVTQYGINLPLTGAISRWLWFSLLHQFGGTFLNADGTSAVDSEPSKKALQFLVDLNFKYKVGSQGGEGDLFATGLVVRSVRFLEGI